MEALFKEMRSFESRRADYMDDDEYSAFQQFLLKKPTAGDTIKGTGGLRKIRWSDPSRGKGKRSGVRIIYYWFDSHNQFWLFTLYNKDEMTDLTDDQKKQLKVMLDREIREAKKEDKS